MDRPDDGALLAEAEKHCVRVLPYEWKMLEADIEEGEPRRAELVIRDLSAALRAALRREQEMQKWAAESKSRAIRAERDLASLRAGKEEKTDTRFDHPSVLSTLTNASTTEKGSSR